MSIRAALGHRLSFKDDLESLTYVLYWLLLGNLPWTGRAIVDMRETKENIGEIKKLCGDLPQAFFKLSAYTAAIEFDDEPDYNQLI